MSPSYSLGRRRLMQTALLTSIPALLIGCATPRLDPEPGMPSWSGRLALRIDSDPPQSFSAGFDLRGTPATGELLLTSPLGQAVATVIWSLEAAEMHQGGQITRRASLDELTSELVGAAVPVGALFGWLRGETPVAQGWMADLSRHGEGRITAKRSLPLPTAELRLVFQP